MVVLTKLNEILDRFENNESTKEEEMSRTL